jgi:hypothetical protein
VPDKPAYTLVFKFCDIFPVKYGFIFFIAYHRFSVQEQYSRPLASTGLRFLEKDVSNSVFEKFSTED